MVFFYCQYGDLEIGYFYVVVYVGQVFQLVQYQVGNGYVIGVVWQIYVSYLLQVIESQCVIGFLFVFVLCYCVVVFVLGVGQVVGNGCQQVIGGYQVFYVVVFVYGYCQWYWMLVDQFQCLQCIGIGQYVLWCVQVVFQLQWFVLQQVGQQVVVLYYVMQVVQVIFIYQQVGMW